MPSSSTGAASSTLCSSTSDRSTCISFAVNTPAASPTSIAPMVTRAPKTTQRTLTGSSARVSAERTADRLGGCVIADRRDSRLLPGVGTRDGRSPRTRRSRPRNHATKPITASSGVTASSAPGPRP